MANVVGDEAQGRISSTIPETIICVDRSVRPAYPDWVKEVMHPELEAVGPTEYDLEQVIRDSQDDGKWLGDLNLYEHLKKTGGLENCLGFHDALEIQKKGIKVFRKLFGGEAVVCWKAVVRNQEGRLFVPYLRDDGCCNVVVHWHYFGDGWFGRIPVARFAN